MNDSSSNEVTDAATIVRTAVGEHPAATTAELALATGLGRSTVQKALKDLEDATVVTRTPGGRDGGRRLADRWNVVLDKGARKATTHAGPAAAERLRKGELRPLVRAVLAADPARELSPATIAKSLGRSAGAVSNALDRLVEAGAADLVGSAPRRFRITRESVGEPGGHTGA